MPDTFIKIASVTVGAGGASSIDFTSIPSTYTDLCIKISARTTATSASTELLLTFNGSTSSFSGRYLLGTGSSALSGTLARYAGQTEPTGFTSNTFSSHDIYIPNYAGSNNKSYSVDAVTENNATTSYADLIAGLWSNTSAITSISIVPATALVQYSTAVLYGIKNS